MTITAKSAVAVALVPLCFLPALFLAYQTQVRLAAFEGVGARMERAGGAAMARVVPPGADRRTAASGNQALLVPATVTDVESLPDAPPEALQRSVNVAWPKPKPAATPARGCKAWRPLEAGPDALAARVGPVRVCEGAPPDGTRRVASQAPARARPRAAKRPATMSFVFDLRDPR